MSIVQGDHGYVVLFTVKKPNIENLEGAIVEVTLKRGEQVIPKQATIIDAASGKCSFTLSSTDLTIMGVYQYQWTTYFPDGRIYSGKGQDFYASERLLMGAQGGGTQTIIVPFARVEELEALQAEVDILKESGGGGGAPSNVILFEDWAGGESVTIDTSTTPTDTTPPNNVTGLQATNVAATSLTLSWNAVSDAVSYEVYRGTTLIGTVTSATINVTGLTASTSYQLTVKAKDAAGNVASGTTITQSTTAPSSDTTAPDNVTGLSFSNVTQAGATLTWVASASSDIASYDIYNGATLLGNVAGTTFNASGLTASTQYTLTVKAKDSAGNVASGTSVTFTTSAPADTTAPVLTITPAATFADTQTVTMSTNETATIYYTLDDSDPKVSGTKLTYTAPLTLTETDTIKAYAKDTAGNDSAVQTVTYTKEVSGTVERFINTTRIMGSPSGTIGWKMSAFLLKESKSISEVHSSVATGSTWELWSVNKTDFTLLNKLGTGVFDSTGTLDSAVSETYFKSTIPPIPLTLDEYYVVAVNYTVSGAKNTVSVDGTTNNTLISTADLKGKFNTTPATGVTLNNAYIYDVKVKLV